MGEDKTMVRPPVRGLVRRERNQVFQDEKVWCVSCFNILLPAPFISRWPYNTTNSFNHPQTTPQQLENSNQRASTLSLRLDSRSESGWSTSMIDIPHHFTLFWTICSVWTLRCTRRAVKNRQYVLQLEVQKQTEFQNCRCTVQHQASRWAWHGDVTTPVGLIPGGYTIPWRFRDPRFRNPSNLLKSDSVLECIKAGIHGAFKHSSSSTMAPSLPALNTDVTSDTTGTLRPVGGALQRTTSLFIRMFLAEPSLQEFSAIFSDSWASPTSRGRLS